MSGTQAELTCLGEKNAYEMAQPEVVESGQVEILLSAAEEKRLLRKIDLQ